MQKRLKLQLGIATLLVGIVAPVLILRAADESYLACAVALGVFCISYWFGMRWLHAGLQTEPTDLGEVLANHILPGEPQDRRQLLVVNLLTWAVIMVFDDLLRQGSFEWKSILVKWSFGLPFVAFLDLASPFKQNASPDSGFAIHAGGIRIVGRWIPFEDIVSVERARLNPASLRVKLQHELVCCGGTHISEQNIDEVLSLLSELGTVEVCDDAVVAA